MWKLFSIDAEFDLIEATLHGYKDKAMVKVKCKIDGSWLPLCPPRSDLSTILSQHIQSKTHLKAMEMVRHACTPIMSGFPCRPRKQEALPSNQQTLSKFLVSTLRPSSSQGCEFSTPHYFGL